MKEWKMNSKFFLPVLLEEKPDSIILDSYYVTFKYMKTLRRYSKLIYIDDVLSFPYPADMLINYNIYATGKQYTDLYVNSELPKLLLGYGHVPLREEFQTGKVIGIRNDVKIFCSLRVAQIPKELHSDL